jgi:carbon storage regulator CsrA
MQHAGGGRTLVVARRTGESIVVGDVTIVVLSADRRRVRLGISAPENIRVTMKEAHSPREGKEHVH